MSARVLIVEDEKHLADGLRFNLEAEGYAVETSGDGEAALSLLLGSREKFDAVVLDVMLPGLDGFEVAARLRQAGEFVPVLMLTARGRAEDVLRGFESGADDYLPKPFELSILIARLRGLLRRREWLSRGHGNAAPPDERASSEGPHGSGPAGREAAGISDGPASVAAAEDLFAFDGKTIDFGALELRVEGRPAVRLTLMEADLLRYFVRHADRAVSRRSVLEEVWNLREDTDTRAIDNFVVRLRKYIEDEPSRPRHLVTVRGVGYRFIPRPAAATPES